MASKSQINCDTSWTTEEMIENANKWSLAGDVALLNTIKSFSKNMLIKTEELSQNIDDLLYKVDEVSLKLDISQNQFHSLKNTQFIENRVYEDDETLDSKEEEKVVEKPPSEEDQEKIISESVISGLEILNKYYDMVEVSISDSDEEEESLRSFILKPKDTYAHRLLPPVIGTDEWYKRWNSEESSSDSEDNKMVDIYSESDSEDNLPKDLFKGSETSSELDFSSQTSENRPVANSTISGSTRRPELVTPGQDNEEPEPLPVNTQNKSFAEQLAAKLDSVISTEEDLSSQINRERIQPEISNTFGGNLFPDEPPPLTESEDRLFPKSASAGLFSGGDTLFDDDDFLSHGNRNEISTNEKGNGKLREHKQKTDNLRQDINRNTSFLPKSSKVSKGLFDSDDSSDDGIFSTSKTHLTKPAFLKPSRPIVPLFDNEPPKLEDEYKSTEDVTKKKPVGGVSIFGNSNIFGNDDIRNILKNQQQNIANDLFKEVEENTDAPELVTPKEIVKEKVPIKRKQFNLFEDDTDDNSSQVFKKEQTSRHNIFDEEDVDMEKKIHVIKEPLESKSVDSEEIAQDEKSYGKVEIEKVHKNVNLFDDEFQNISLPSKKSHISLFSDDDELFKDDLFSEISAKKFRTNLFDDVQNSNDLFGIKTDNVKNTVCNDDLKNENEVIANKGILSDLNTKEIIHSLHSPTLKVEDKSEFEHHIGVAVKEDNLNNNRSAQRTEDNSLQDEFIVPDYGKVQIKNNKLFENDDENLFQVQHGQNVSGSKHEVTIPSLLDDETTPNYDRDTRIKQKEEKIIVRLFDSTPPPNDDDDGDWDRKSDNFYDAEDYTPYHIDDNMHSSSLFDEEPPSLDPNESSGIVGDHSTRVDDASFNPYASSSRRPSSDIFSDQQSQDSFFVTKSRVESRTVPPNLDIIQEDSKTSMINITTSGNLEDSNFTQKTDILESGNNLFGAEGSHTNSIFDGENVLESVVKEQENSKILNEGKGEDDVKNLLFDQKNDILQRPTEKIGSESEITLSRKNSAVASIADMLKNELDNKTPEMKVSPGKLKHSLNINVNALIPGYTPQKARELSKSQSLDSPKEEDWRFEKPQIPHTSSTSAIHKNLSGTALEKAVSFDDADNVDVLHSMTKDRAKLPFNRRPSTRRGRRAAIRKSVIDNESISNNEQSEEKEVENTSNSLEIASQIVEVEKNPVQEKITEQNIPEIIKEEVEKHRGVIPQNSSKASLVLSRGISDKNKDLFESGSESDNDLFNPTQKKSKNEKNVTKSLFDDISKRETNLKKSLFDDVSSDEDLFSSASNSSFSRKSETAAKSSQRRVQKAAPVKKLENIETSEDPLSSLFK